MQFLEAISMQSLIFQMMHSFLISLTLQTMNSFLISLKCSHQSLPHLLFFLSSKTSQLRYPLSIWNKVKNKLIISNTLTETDLFLNLSFIVLSNKFNILMKRKFLFVVFMCIITGKLFVYLFLALSPFTDRETELFSNNLQHLYLKKLKNLNKTLKCLELMRNTKSSTGKANMAAVFENCQKLVFQDFAQGWRNPSLEVYVFPQKGIRLYFSEDN